MATGNGGKLWIKEVGGPEWLSDSWLSAPRLPNTENRGWEKSEKEVFVQMYN